MARISVYILFCSFFILLHPATYSQASTAANFDNLPFSIDEVMVISLSGLCRYSEQSDHPSERFLSPACLFSFPGRLSEGIPAAEEIVVSDPTQTLASREERDRCNPRKTSMDSTLLNRRAISAVAQRTWFESKSISIDALESVARTSRSYYQWVLGKANERFMSISWCDIPENSAQSLKKLIPLTLISHATCDLARANASPPETIAEEANARELVSEDPMRLELPVETQDSYWQYYEDCDRWGVDFASLLTEAIASQGDEEGTQGQSHVPGTSPQCLMLQIVGSQNLSIWLYRIPRIEHRSFITVTHWLKSFALHCGPNSEAQVGFSDSKNSSNGVNRLHSVWPTSKLRLTQRIKTLMSGLTDVGELIRSVFSDPFGTQISMRELPNFNN